MSFDADTREIPKEAWAAFRRLLESLSIEPTSDTDHGPGGAGHDAGDEAKDKE